LLDKWLLHQPLFRGKYVKNTTFSALLKLVEAKNEHIDSLMVVGYDPSHKNVNSEVRTPFKILSIILRMIENETKIEKRFAKQGDKKETDNYKFSYQDDERLDTIGGDDDEDMYDF